MVEKIKPLDVLWIASGMRVRSVKGDILKKMRDAGCVAVYFGMESGSDKMLKVMEKMARKNAFRGIRTQVNHK